MSEERKEKEEIEWKRKGRKERTEEMHMIM